jgi:hypothetical protein
MLGDLLKGRDVLREMFPAVAIRMFYARPNQNGHVDFIELS